MRRARDDRGAVAILGLCIVVLAGLVLIGLGRAGSAAGRSARAETAADSAALAAALTLGHGGDTPAAALAAASAAADNGATLRRCDCNGHHAEVTVTIGDATGRARAEFDRPCALVPEACGR